jgi:hypothetical protein
VRALNLTLRFLLEVCALAALGYGGWQVGGPFWVRGAAAVLLVLIGALIWARWVAPKASHPLPDPQRLIPEWVVFGGATVALAVTGHPILAAVLAVLAALNRAALWRLGTGTGGQPLHPIEAEDQRPTTGDESGAAGRPDGLA